MHFLLRSPTSKGYSHQTEHLRLNILYMDFAKEVQEHNQKYDFDLLYYEAYTSETKARERERKLKHYGSAWRGLKDRITE